MIFNKITNFINENKQQLKMVSDVFLAIVELHKKEKKHILDYISTVSKITSIYSENQSSGYEYFLKNGWEKMAYGRLDKPIFDTLITFYPHKIISYEHDKICEINVGDISFGALMGDNGYMDYHVRNRKKAIDLIQKSFWQNIGSNQCCIISNTKDEISFTKEPQQETIIGKQVISCVEEMKKFYEKGISRSVLFYGQPGSGKTTIIKDIAKKLEMRTLRIPVSSVGRFQDNVIIDSISLFKPDILIMDDLDRSSSIVQLLDDLEKYKFYIKFIFASMNNPEKVDPALIRPGRFDKHIKIEYCDPKLIRKILGNKDDETVFEKIKHWPVAYIKEYCNIRDTLGEESALKEIDELEHRLAYSLNLQNDEF